MTKKEVFDYINSGIDKNGSLKKENGFKNHFPELYDEYKQINFPDEIKKMPFKQKIWHFLNDIYDIPVCKTCGNPVAFETKSGKWGYRTYCSGYCAMQDKDTKNKIKSTTYMHYGVEHPLQSNIIQDKARETNLEKYGVENYAKTNEYHDKVKHTNLEKYGVEYYSQSDECKEKVKNTCLEKYGVENYAKTNEYIDKIKKTNLERYGKEYYQQTEEGKQRMKETCINNYGIDNYAKSDEFKEKMIDLNNKKYGTESFFQSKQYKDHIEEYKKKSKETCMKLYDSPYYAQSNDYRNNLDKIKDKTIQTSLKKYGKEYYSQTDEYKNKIRHTYLEKYGVENYSQTDDFKEKQYNTKKQNNSFNSSSIEKQFDEFLKSLNIEYISQYKSNLYPYSCDFYIMDIDLYIEIQGSWTHGGHPFDNSNQEDLNKLSIWKEKSKESDYYKQAIYTWTNLDVRKRNIAKENELNYLEIFSDNLDECKSILYDYIIHMISNFCITQKFPGTFKWPANHPIWSCNVGNKLSPIDAWNNKNYIEKAVKNIISLFDYDVKFRDKHINEFMKCKIKNNQIISSTYMFLKLILDRFTIAKIAPKVTALSANILKNIIYESNIDISNGIYIPMAGFGGIVEGAKMWGKEHNKIIECECYDINPIFCKWYGWTQRDMLSQKIKTDKVCICCPPFGIEYEHWNGTPKDMSNISFKEWYHLIKEYVDAPKYIIIGPEINNKSTCGLFAKKVGVMIWTDDMIEK